MSNVEPPGEIPANWRSKFRGLYRDCVGKRLEFFHDDEEAGYREDLETNIRKDKRHRELVNLCIFPFFEHRLGGYEFVRGDPLAELDVPNFDFLLWDFDGHAIFGEVKANVGEGWEGRCVSEVLDQIEIIEENEDYIVENYLGSDMRHKEYVLAVFYPDADRIAKAIIRERENIVTWRVHQMDKQIRVHSSAPPREAWIDDPDDYYDIVQHSDSRLNSVLRTQESSTECLDFFPKSHPVTELRTLISAAQKEPPNVFVNEQRVVDYVRESLFYLNEEAQQITAERIIGLGLNIEFLDEWDGEEGDYKIVSRYTKSNGLEKTLEKKWIDYKVEQKRDMIRGSCRDEVMDWILEQTKPQTRISDFV